jgi:hypothetical protein
MKFKIEESVEHAYGYAIFLEKFEEEQRSDFEQFGLYEVLEKEFLNLWLEFYPNTSIKRCFSIKYINNNKEKIYYPDFIITYPDNKKETS